MDVRERDLSQIKAYIDDVDKEVTMILQSLQWDRKDLLETAPLTACSYNTYHRVPLATKVSHEAKCLLKSCGYTQEDILLPDPPDDKSSTLVKLSKEDINQIIDNAAKCDPSFKRGAGIEDVQPLTVERLQSSYTADERREIHDAVVNVVPTIHQLSDLALPGGDDEMPTRERSRVEVLAELRDMKRRRTKYRTAARTSKYSDVLRDVIKIQMDLYCEALGVDQTYEVLENVYDNNHDTTQNQEHMNKIPTKNNSMYHKEMSKNTKYSYTDNRYTRNYKESLSERPKHKFQDNRREHYNGRYRNDSSEDSKRRNDIKHRRHHKQERDERRQPKLETYEYKLDREIKREPEEYSAGHSSKSYEERSCEQSTSKYRNDDKYKDRQRLYNKEYYFCSSDYDSERRERNSKHSSRYKERHGKWDRYEHHERKPKNNDHRAKEDFYIRDKDMKRERSDDSATEDNIKRKKYSTK